VATTERPNLGENDSEIGSVLTKIY
jgi:hypothetical protein